MMRSLQGRLIVLVGACSTAGLLVFGVIVCLIVESRLWAQFDNGMRERLLQLTQLVEQRDGKIEYEWNESGATAIQAVGERVTCWDGDRVIAVLPENAEPLPLTMIAADQRLSPLELDGERARVIAMPFVPRLDEDDTSGPVETITLAVARPIGDIISTIGIIRWSLTTAAGLALALTMACVWIAVRRGLAPIHIATRAIAEVTPHRLDQPIRNVDSQPSELHPLLTTINQLVSSLRVAMERERTLSGEIAHEMRTPLAGLRAKFDVALSKPRSSEELRGLIEDCSRINDDVTSMIESLMATVVPVTCEGKPFERVSLTQSVESCILHYDDRLTQRGLQISHQIEDGVQAFGSEHATRIVVRNLIDNAVSYADTGTTIEIECCQVGDTARLAILNQASQFPAKKIDQVFERFWRADASRSKSEAHSGLGLALTKRIIEAHGGTIAASYSKPFFKIVAQWGLHA
ncbi:MAG: GHKL domain-containing protein [Phycisphaera sp. RhM]|nr:GHKL domain-containing protein [Phycisphaera sp. RhM]